MKRREFLAGLCAVTVLPAAHAQAPAKIHRIGILTFGFAPSSPPLEALRQGLREQGYTEGKNIALEYRFAQGRTDRLPALATELIGLNVELIVTEGTPTALAIKKTTSTVPIVMAAVSDPVGLGLVPSLSRPGGNITGLTLSGSDRAGKQLQLLKEIAPKATVIAVIHNAARPDAAKAVAEARDAARSLALNIQFVEVRSPADFDAAFEAVTSMRANALTTLGDGMLWGNRKHIVDFANKSRLPAVFPEREFAEAGGLMAYGPDVESNFRRAAAFVDKILRGTKPADLPIEQPTKHELVINLKTETALGIKIPGPVLVRADNVIQ